MGHLGVGVSRPPGAVVEGGGWVGQLEAEPLGRGEDGQQEQEGYSHSSFSVNSGVGVVTASRTTGWRVSFSTSAAAWGSLPRPFSCSSRWDTWLKELNFSL